MTPNLNTIDDAVPALLHLTSFREEKGELTALVTGRGLIG